MSHERRIFVESILEGDEHTLASEDSHYLKNVLRLGVAAPLVLVDTQHSVEYDAVVAAIGADGAVTVKVFAARERQPYVSKVSVLLCALCKQDASELIVEKSTELGVATIIFFQSERSIAKVGNEKDRQKKIDRFNKIADSAVRQSARMNVPEIIIAESLSSAYQLLNDVYPHVIKCVAALVPNSLTISSTFKDVSLLDETSIALAIGPEGDFSPKEYELLLGNSFAPITLGGNRLRAETAVIAAIAGIDAVLTR